MKKNTNKSLHVQEQLTKKIIARASVKGTVLVAVGAILWALSSACGQFLMSSKGFSSEWLASTRILLAGVLLTAIGVTQNKKAVKELLKNKKDMFTLAMFGIFGLMLAQLTFLKAIDASDAGTATVLQYTAPILIIVFVCIKTLRFPTVTEAISIVLAVTGVFLLATKGNFSLAIPLKALIYGMMTSIGMMLFTLLPQKIIPKYGSILVTGLAMICGGIVMFFLVRPWRFDVSFDFVSVIAYIGLAVTGTTVGYTLYMQGVADIGPLKSSMIASIEPVASAIFAAFLGTKFLWQDFVGMACIIITVFILSLPPKNIKIHFHPSKKKSEKVLSDNSKKEGDTNEKQSIV